MNSTPLRFFTQAYSPDFWREHDIVAAAEPDTLLSIKRRGYPGLAGEDAMRHRPSEQAEARKLVQAHMLALTPPSAPGALMVASQNVAAFNEAYAQAEPLEHPALTALLPVDTVFTQLAYELCAIEHASAQCADDYDTALEQMPPKPGDGAAFDAFMVTATDRCAYDLLRLDTKYADALVPLKGVTSYASHLGEVLRQTERAAPQTLVPTLRRLTRACHELRRQAIADWNRMETLYSRAAPIMREAASPCGQVGTPPRAVRGHFGGPAVSPAGPGPLGLVDDHSIELLLHKLYALRGQAGGSRALPNFFGPGVLHGMNAAQISAYGLLCGNTLTALNELRRLRIGPVLAELRLAIAACLRLGRRRADALTPPRP